MTFERSTYVCFQEQLAQEQGREKARMNLCHTHPRRVLAVPPANPPRSYTSLPTSTSTTSFFPHPSLSAPEPRDSPGALQQ